MELGAELSGLVLEQLIAGAGCNQLPEIALAHGILDDLTSAGELRQVEGVAIENDHVGIALLCLVPLDAAIFQNQEAAVCVLHHLAALGNDGDALRGIAAVVHQQAHQKTVGPAFTDVESEALFDRGEAAGLHDVADQIGAHLGDPPAQHPKTFRRDKGADRHQHHRRDDRDRDERFQQAPGAHARAVHHDDFGIGGKLVKDVGHRDDQRHRRDHHDQLRDDKAGDADERQDGLALAGHQVDVAQRLGQPDGTRQTDEHQQERPKCGAKNIPAD